MSDLAVHAGLFGAALAAASVLPVQSEAASRPAPIGPAPALLLLVASAGNTAGSVVNWALGRSVERYRHRRWFPPDAAAPAQGWYRRYGRRSLLLSRVPVVGDPLTVVAGVVREPFLLLVALAKTGRYSALAALMLGWA